MKKVFIGFGFGAIQGGLFLYEAFYSGQFDRFVVAEIMPEIVHAIRQAKGRYWVNVATDLGIDQHEIGRVEIYNPTVPQDRASLVEAVSQADEIATALPSVKFYDAGEPNSVAHILSEGFERRMARSGLRSPASRLRVALPPPERSAQAGRYGGRRKVAARSFAPAEWAHGLYYGGVGRRSQRTIIYTAENHNHAAEILEEKILGQWRHPLSDFKDRVQCLNTVIGKMSGMVTDEMQIVEQDLARMAGDSGRCFLVEAFNHILISRIRWPDFQRGVTVFEEKEDLLPFEEAKLYGHNATHALIGYLARLKGYALMAEVRHDHDLLTLAREAFIEESGKALCRRHQGGLDPLFTDRGYIAYADDLLKRMMNPHLRDRVDRVVRDPHRKLGWEDRLIGTMRVALGQGITPLRYARGARAAFQMLKEAKEDDEESLLDAIWAESHASEKEKREIKALIFSAQLL